MYLYLKIHGINCLDSQLVTVSYLPGNTTRYICLIVPRFDMNVKTILFQLLLLCVTALAMLSEAESKADVPDNLNEILHTLGRQIMLQKLDMEESVRATYASGVKQIRQASKGSQPYHHDTWQGNSVIALHGHSNYDRILGIGEFDAILNGVEFRLTSVYKFIIH